MFKYAWQTIFFLITNKYGKYIVVVLVIIDVKNTIVLLFAYSSTTTINLMFNICVFQNRGHDMDMNVQRAWKKGYTGQGVVVSILDDGIERDHPDLKNNYVSTHYTSIHGKNTGKILSINCTFSASEYFSKIEKFQGFQHINTSRITLHHF